jgi:hypothetical protein
MPRNPQCPQDRITVSSSVPIPLVITFGAAVAAGRCVSLFLRGLKPRVRNFDTEPPSSYRYELQLHHRLESVANAHTAADLRVRP